jgi:hypothetical protein
MPHHYINLIDPNVNVNANILTYDLQAVSNEESGTYAIDLKTVMQHETIQSFPLHDFQIGTDIVYVCSNIIRCRSDLLSNYGLY